MPNSPNLLFLENPIRGLQKAFPELHFKENEFLINFLKHKDGSVHECWYCYLGFLN